MSLVSSAHGGAAAHAPSHQELRNWLLFVLSGVAIFALQPSTPIRQLDFWLPLFSLSLSTIVWAATTPAPNRAALRDALALGGVLVVMLASRHLEPLAGLWGRAQAPSPIGAAIVAVAVAGAAFALHSYFTPKATSLVILTVTMLGLLIALKFAPATQALSAGFRWMQGQSIAQASALDVQWLGFSYLAFRLVHVIRERATGKLPALSLREFITYAVFFPTLIAGPIDRAERFVKDLRAGFTFNADDLAEGARRIAWGLFKKFVLADTLALIALNEVNATQSHSGFWTWVMVYAFALRIFLDFSGYTDIAIGVARAFGVKLPENFSRPYLKPNLTQFWNSWHMTLAQWFRAYYFNPLTRALRQRGWAAPIIIAIAQISTMLLIGLWHAITPNFAIWGLWHGVGLFVHNRWAEWTKSHPLLPSRSAALQQVASAAGTLLTFHYVALGWVWFAVSDTSTALSVLQSLIGWQR
ncbi:MAG: MBOAT family O-acyltransferase [Thermoflexales bacterium]